MRDDIAQVYVLLLALDTRTSLAVVDEEGESCFTLVMLLAVSDKMSSDLPVTVSPCTLPLVPLLHSYKQVPRLSVGVGCQ